MVRVMRRRWRRWQAAYTEYRLRRRREARERREAKERARMETDAIKLAAARTTLGQLDPAYIEAFETVVADKIRPAIREEERNAARAELVEEVERAKERLAAKAAAEQAQLDRQLERREAEAVERAERRARREVEDELDAARTAATHGQQRAAVSEAHVLALVKGLLPEGQKVYLGRYGLTELDVFGLNQVLHRHGLDMQHDIPSQEFPELVVKVHVAEAHWEAATRFWTAAHAAADEPVSPISGLPMRYVVPVVPSRLVRPSG